MRANPLLTVLAAFCLTAPASAMWGSQASVAIGPEWTPIDTAGDRVTLCVLNFGAYHADPPRYPMFRDLVKVSGCHGRNRRVVTLAQLRATHATLPAAGSGEPGAPLPPSGFVFHESRCGSTLIANMLAASPHRLVFTESSSLWGAVSGGDNEAAAATLRTVITQMGRATGGTDSLLSPPGPMHTRLFFKLQSALVHHIPLFQRAFPETPWIFVFRTPVEVMVSHIGAKLKRGNNAPCLRSRYSRDAAVLTTLEDAGVRTATKPWARKELWCAGHLATLCRLALAAADRAEAAPRAARVAGLRAKRGSSGGLSVPVFVNHASLVPTMLDYVLPRHFHTPLSVEERKAILKITKHYSKDRGGGRKWTPDSKAKQEDASTQLRHAAATVLEPFFARLKRRVPRLEEAGPVV